MARRAKDAATVERNWKKLADDTRAKAQALPAGMKRDAMMRMASELDMACHMSDWLTTPKAPLPSA